MKRWDDWRTFLAVARAGTIAAAAEELGVNQTTVYRRLDALEADFGTRLFDRDAKGYALTVVGRDAVEHAERVEEEMLALERMVRGHDRQASGEVVVTLPESLLPALLPALVAFGEAHPRIELALELHDRMFDLGRREADVAIRPSLQPPAEAVGRRIAAVAWTVYGVAGVGAAPWVSYTEQLGDLAAERWRRGQAGGKASRMSVSTVPAMRAVLAHGDRRGMLPCFVGDVAPELERQRDPEEAMGSALWLLIHADLRRNARVRAFVDFLYPRLEALRPIFEGTG